MTARKLEEGPLENYTHMATLIHKMNLLLLEFDNIPQLRNILRIVYSKKLLNTIVDFVMNTDNFANFGVRFLEILSLEFCKEVVNSEILGVLQGLLRTNDYETVVQSLSFLSVLTENASLTAPEEKANFNVSHVLNKKLLALVMKTVASHNKIEYIHFTIQIVHHALSFKELRNVIIAEILPKQKSGFAADEPLEADEKPYTYSYHLKAVVEKLPEVMALPKLLKRVERQRKEIESWEKATTVLK